ncbi:hypothetical protein [Halalkalicoccus ordinarius]|uniref:hypothetical protein n=1 Tax=Halalkalicoccus ordinarius TaxID=3116651 RepID=UPI00300F6AD7
MLGQLFQLARSGERSDYDELTCPTTGRRFATRDTDPIEWDPIVDHGTGIATYECGQCNDRHTFLWSPRTPVLLAESDRGKRRDPEERLDRSAFRPAGGSDDGSLSRG